MRIINGVFIILFMTMLTLPLAFVNLSKDRVSVQENRMLAGRPSPADIKNHPGKFIKQFDAWFKDSTGFRKYLLALFNIMDKSKWLNGFMYTDGQYTYLVGEEGHHYFANVGGKLIQKFQGKQFLSDEQMLNMANKLEDVKRYLERQNIPFVVMFCADKESIYPEFYPKFIIRGSDPIQLDVITNYLHENTSVDVFNIKEALLAKKNNYLLYYKIDTMSFASDFAHYNQIGAFLAYLELMKHINAYFPRIVPYGLHDINIDYDGKGIPAVSLKAETVYKKQDVSFFDNVDLIRPFTWENEAYENRDPDLPKVLFLRDSYTSEQFLGKYFAQHFGTAVFIHYANASNFEEFVSLYKPDIVVFESAERALENFANCIAGIPELP